MFPGIGLLGFDFFFFPRKKTSKQRSFLFSCAANQQPALSHKHAPIFQVNCFYMQIRPPVMFAIALNEEKKIN